MPDAADRLGTRHGRPEDAAGLAALHVAVWRETYRGIAPDAAYLALDEARRLPYWQATLGANDPLTGAILAASGSDMLGVVSFGRPVQPEMDGAVEVKHLYVSGHARGGGLGRRLLEASFDHLRGAGCRRAALAVVRENAAARRFYERMGGAEGGEFIDPGPLWRSSNIIVTWSLDGSPGVVDRQSAPHV
ncbi:MAG: GNAT family N-acetyltransferase [Pseudomonadota bacterium]